MTISFNVLGHYGRLGNQMFQYATLKSIASKHGYKFTIPDSRFQDPYHDHQLFEAFELSSLSEDDICINRVNKRIEEQHFHFDENLYENCPDNVDLLGYFQSEKYFVSIKDEVKKDFTFKKDTLSAVKEYRENIPESKIIALHIRRGDYVGQPWHGCQSLEYYEKALSMLPDIPVVIFTDDPKWAFEQEMFESDKFYVSDGNDNLFDMCFMSMCNYHIIANSSFSWWGAWLSDSEKVIAPKRWFGPPLSEKNNTKDLLPDSWIKL